MTEKIPYRQIHLDFHTSEQISGVGEKFNAAEFTETLKAANVDSINLFAKCHHGMFYYPTALGTQHPGLKGMDLVGKQVRALKDAGIRVIMYTCVGWNEEWAHNYPQWQQRDKNGVTGIRAVFEREYYSWNDLCLNKPDYRKVLKDEIVEEYNLFKPAGYWIDIVYQRGCVCDDCIKGIKSLGMDPQNENHVKKHDRLVEIDFCRDFYEFIKKLDPELEVYFNSFPYEIDMADDESVSSYEKRKYFDYIDIESLPSDSWGYAHFPMAVNYLNKYDKEVTMMNGKFHMAWGDFGSVRNLEALEYECFRAIANGAKVCVGDQLHPSGMLDKAVYERIGKVFASIRDKEPWLKGTKKLCDVAVLTPSLALSGDAMNGNYADEGAYRVLTEAKIPFDYINYLDNIDKYKLIILPDKAILNEMMVGKLNKFTSNGGKILCTGTSGLVNKKFALDAIGAVYIDESEYDTRYIRLNEGEFANIPAIDHVLYFKGVKVSVSASGKVIANIVPPYFNRSYEHFCSHRQTPPVPDASEEPAIIQSSNCIYISSPLFADFAYNGYKAYKDILVACIGKLLPVQLCEADLPVLSEVTLREKTDGLVVHTLSYAITRKCKAIDIIEDRIELSNKKYKIYSGFMPSKVSIVPEGKELDFSFDEGYVSYTVDYQCGHSMVFIQK